MNYLESEKISKLLLKFCIPAIVGMLVQSLYNVVDRIFVSKGVGELAFSGLTVTFPVMLIIMGFSMLFGIGSASVLSIRMGEKDMERAELVAANALVLLAITSVVITVLGFAFMNQILRVLSASEHTIQYAIDYLQVIFAGTVFQVIGFGMNHVMRASGQPKLSMMTNLIGAGLNIVLDALFIFVLHWGIRGAAVATVISQAVSAAWVLSYFWGRHTTIKMRKKNFRLRKDIVFSAVAIGVSPFSIQIAGSLVNIIANWKLKTYGGDLAIAAMGAINSIATIFLMPLFGINQGSQPVIGYNYGAKRYDRVKETLKYTLSSAVLICCVGWIVIQAFPHVVIRLFAESDELMDIAGRGIRIFLFVLPLSGIQIISTTFYQATNKALIALFCSLLRQVILLIPLYLILPGIMGLDGVWYSTPIADTLAVLITVILLIYHLKKMTGSQAEPV